VGARGRAAPVTVDGEPGGNVRPDTVATVAAYLRSRWADVRPEVLVVLGSGLGAVADRVERARTVPFEEIPDMPRPTVPGHAGHFTYGRIGGVLVLVQGGRFHAYEGHPPEVLGLTVRVAAALGVSTLVVTNAAGAVRADLEPGDLVLLEDQMNLMGTSPLVGPPREGETRFPDMGAPYDAGLRTLALQVAAERDIDLRTGVYAAMLGPAYETAAEVRMVGKLGADLVGMSTVPEVLVARALGLRCLGFSMVTNKGTGLSTEPVTHEEVLEVGRLAGQRLADLLVACLERMPSPDAGASPGQSDGAK